MIKDPLLYQIYADAVLQEAQERFKSGCISAEDYNHIRLDCRAERGQAAQWVAALVGENSTLKVQKGT